MCAQSQGVSRWVGLELGPQQQGWGWELSTQMSGAVGAPGVRNSHTNIESVVADTRCQEHLPSFLKGSASDGVGFICELLHAALMLWGSGHGVPNQTETLTGSSGAAAFQGGHPGEEPVGGEMAVCTPNLKAPLLSPLLSSALASALVLQALMTPPPGMESLQDTFLGP